MIKAAYIQRYRILRYVDRWGTAMLCTQYLNDTLNEFIERHRKARLEVEKSKCADYVFSVPVQFRWLHFEGQYVLDLCKLQAGTPEEDPLHDDEVFFRYCLLCDAFIAGRDR